MIRRDQVLQGFVILGIMFLMLAGCTQPAEPTATAVPPTRVEISPTDTPTVEAPAAPAVSATPEATAYPAPPTPLPRRTVVYPAPSGGEGRKLLNERCGVCHGVDRATSKRKTANEWRETILLMRDKDANPIDAEVETLTQFLTAAYGK